MGRKLLCGGVFLLAFLILSSTGFSTAILPSEKSNLFSEKKIIESDLAERDIDAKSLLKNLFFGRDLVQNTQYNLFTSLITTNCEGIQKTSEITFAAFNDIDVDNNENTGINGKDIRVQYLLLPYFVPGPELTLGVIFSVSVERIGDEIKDKSFSLSATLADNLVSVGYESPKASTNEIPLSIQLSSMVFIEISKGTTGFSISMNPSYASNQEGKEIVLFAGFDDTNVKRSYSFGFSPATETQITLRATKDPDKWQYSFTKDTPFDTVFTAEMTKTASGMTKETRLTIDSLPNEISFALALTPFSSQGGSIEYESDSMYDVNVLVETGDIGRCKYALIENTPKKLYAEWIPSKENGFYHVDIESSGTTIRVFNSLHSPTINLSINDLRTVDLTAFWNLTNPGDLNIIKDPSLEIDMNILFEDWEMELDAQPTAENINFAWKSNISGHLTLDTDQQPLSDIDLMVRGPINGVSITGETLSADDFHLEWTVWPLSEFFVKKTGSIDFATLSIDVYIEGDWYHIWPLF
jgi:hypothetical protein